MAYAQGSLAQERTKMAFDPNKFLVALLVLSLLGLGTTYTVASGDLTPNVFDLFGNLLVATIFGMVR